jgi:hypothetical protein
MMKNVLYKHSARLREVGKNRANRDSKGGMAGYHASISPGTALNMQSFQLTRPAHARKLFSRCGNNLTSNDEDGCDYGKSMFNGV